jgi:hypothetical protein
VSQNCIPSLIRSISLTSLGTTPAAARPTTAGGANGGVGDGDDDDGDVNVERSVWHGR